MSDPAQPHEDAFDPDAPTVPPRPDVLPGDTINDGVDAQAPTAPPRPELLPGDTINDGVDTSAPTQAPGSAIDAPPTAEAAFAATLKLDEGQASGSDSSLTHDMQASSPPSRPAEDDARTVLEPPPSSSGVDDVTLLEPDAKTHASGAGTPSGRLRSSKLPSSASSLRSSKLDLSGGKLVEGAIYAGKYELQHEIARGGMGVVYKARQVDLNRVVALKVMLSGGMAGEEERRRFILEAEASARLKHPNIVPVYDIGEVEGNLYFTMDYVEGSPLSKRKKELDREKLLEVMIQVADGMAFAHQRGIIHRDLKPANIMMDANDTPLIMDFGLAKQVEITDSDGQPSLKTREGVVMGTPHYMPPEQADGRISEIDIRSDIYSLGVILYELWTGELPFQARSITELMFKIYETDPRPPRQLDSSIDWDMEAIILKAIEKSKDLRYQTSADLKRDLENVRDGHPVSARHATIIYRLSKAVRRNRTPLLVSVVIAILAGVAIGAVYRQNHQAALQAQQAYADAIDTAEREFFDIKKRGDALDGTLGSFYDEPAPITERKADVEAYLGTVAKLKEDLVGARGLIQTYLDADHPRAERLERDGFAGEDERQTGWRTRLARLSSVHTQLGAAKEALATASGLATKAQEALGKGERGDSEVTTWKTLEDAMRRARTELDDDAKVKVASGGPAARFQATAEQVRKHVFTALSLADAAWPEAKVAREALEEINTLRAGVQTALQQASRVHRAGVMLARGARVLDLLKQPVQGKTKAERQTKRLRAARLAQSLLQRGKEAHQDYPRLQETSYAANKEYASALLDMKAYLVFDAELAAEDAFTQADLTALKERKANNLHDTLLIEGKLKSMAKDLAASPAPDVAALEGLVTQLEQLERDPRLDPELKVLRADLLESAGRTLESLKREEASREVARAFDLAEEKELAAKGDSESLPDVVASWDSARRLCVDHAELLGETLTASNLRACDVAKARVHYDAALSTERKDPPRALALALKAVALYGPLKGVPGADSKLELARDLVTRLQRVSEKPEGMVLISGRQNVELGSSARDRNEPRRLTIEPFYLAQREVTCREYTEFLASDSYSDPAFWKRLGIAPDAVTPWPLDWQSKQAPAGDEDLPVTGINWYEARGYAHFLGMRLPRDREWEFAARYQGGELLRFPWGQEFESGGLSNALRAPGSNAHDRTRNDVYDLGGNVSEWVVRSEGVEASAETGTPSARGASFIYPAPRIARGVMRLMPRPDYRGPQLGLRLAKDSQ